MVQCHTAPQMSPTVKPFGNGSSGSTPYVAMPVIHAVPVMVGTTARYGPTCVSAIKRPVNTVTKMPAWRKSSFNFNLPLAYNAAIFAQVPVPHGERSSAPVHVAGLFQSKRLVETIAAFFKSALGVIAGADKMPMVTSRISG